MSPSIHRTVAVRVEPPGPWAGVADRSVRSTSIATPWAQAVPVDGAEAELAALIAGQASPGRIKTAIAFSG